MNYRHPLSLYIIEKKIKVKDFAKQIPIGASALSAILNGRLMPSLPTAIRINELTKGKVKPIDIYNAFYEFNPRLKKGIRTRKLKEDNK